MISSGIYHSETFVVASLGALFGAQIGANVGSSRAFDKAKEDEMKRLGVTKEMLEMAEDCGVALERAMEGLKATQDSYETQRAFARRLDSDSDRLYEKAKAAMTASEEEKARALLTERQGMQEKLKKALMSCASARKMLEQQEENVAALEARAMEVEALLQRGVGAKAMQESSDQFSLSDEDPLVKKFRDLDID
uniref:Uncharacterized protein n=1 Tax=Odontella aurita TaxID=265563 RepID=A0A7S4JG19_9STRA|mmetsp:Transcript_45951/g.139529  ORF Transcript_45951/g.139529 Transcript_45951/m.139529 type:complete len:194 (+) Transcript_45951:523-1104(+)